MYLISIYFDEKTTRKMQRYIDLVAEKTGNRFMLEGQVPPHLTVSAFETQNEDEALQALERIAKRLWSGSLTWASVGTFLPYVIFLQPVLNAYLYGISEAVYEELSSISDVKMNAFYQPFGWLPHVTIGKTLTKEQMQSAFAILQENFGVFESTTTKIGLARTNPHRDIRVYALKEAI